MKKKLAIFLLIGVSFISLKGVLFAESAFGSLVALPGESSSSKRDSGPMTITANSMDIDLKNNVITLIGNVKVEDNQSKITSEKMLVYLQDKKDSPSAPAAATGSKSAKAIVALGDVVIIQKNLSVDEKKRGERKATAGRADYDVANGIIILTDNPVLYQGDSYIKGNRIILWKDSDRMKVENNEETNTSSIIVLNQKPADTATDTAVVADTSKDTSAI